jgi:para-nitrobenzyl esterase
MIAAMGDRARDVLARDGADPPIERVLKAQNAAERVAQAFGMQAQLPFGPQMGQAPLPPETELADRIREVARRVDVMLGATKDDVSPFLVMNPGLAPLLRSPLLGRLLTATLTPLVTRRIFMQPARELARQLRSAGGKATVYRFDWAPKAAPLGACHSIEVPFLLGSAQAWSGAPMLGSDYERSFDTLGREMRSLWAEVARSGIAGDAPAFVTLGAGS